MRHVQRFLQDTIYTFCVLIAFNVVINTLFDGQRNFSITDLSVYAVFAVLGGVMLKQMRDERRSRPLPRVTPRPDK